MRGGRSERENRNPRDKDSSTCDDASAFYSQDKAHTTYSANGDGGGGSLAKKVNDLSQVLLSACESQLLINADLYVENSKPIGNRFKP